MVQIIKDRIKAITPRQTEAIKQIIQNRDFNLSEYKKLRKILDTRVITRRDASTFLEYCYAKVNFERYFNGHKHKSYAACYFCKGRDKLRKIENLKTGTRKWCCQTCRINLIDENVVDKDFMPVCPDIEISGHRDIPRVVIGEYFSTHFWYGPLVKNNMAVKKYSLEVMD